MESRTVARDKYILTLDEGTTCAKAIVYDHEGAAKGRGAHEITQIFPISGWVEHDPDEIWRAQVLAMKDAMREARIRPSQIEAAGITNQRETTILWDKRTGRPVYNAIVWQCRRTAMIAEELRKHYSDLIKEKTGLIADSYFSGLKIKWLLDSIPGLRGKCEKGEILFGNVDSFLIWHLTGGKSHTTDYTNASRTMLFNIHKLKWDDELLEIMKIPEEILPVPKPSSNKDSYGQTETGILGTPVEICGDAGDQQAALFGQACFAPRMAKCTYGTGNFVLVNIGAKARLSQHGLLTTVAYSLEQNKANYAFEGSVFITGAAIQWLRDEIKIISSPQETEAMAKKVTNTGGVYFVPAFTGLGAPHWDQYSRGLIIGITRGTSREHIVRAALEAIAYQTRDVIECVKADLGRKIENLRVDGGASANDFLMQFQADVLNIEIVRPSLLETTSLGVGYLAGIATGYWKNTTEIAGLLKIDRIFKPQMEAELRQKLYENWTEAVKRASKWALTLNKTGVNA